MTTYRFGEFRLDPTERVLLRGDTPVPLMPKIFDLLEFMVANAGRMLEKDKLLEAIWHDAFVEEGNLSKAVFLLRKALGEGCIETVPKRGYRFVAAVQRGEPTTLESASKSIAVLPFADLSAAKDREFFCEGVADEIVHALSRLSGIRVAARTATLQFRQPDADPRQVARSLRVRYILAGSVRQSDSRARISVELVDGVDASQLWSERYDRELSDMFAVQDEIAGAVTKALQLRLLGPLPSHRATNPEAYILYLRGRFLMRRRPGKVVDEALTCFRRAVELDPDFAEAHAGIADVYATLGSWEAGAMEPAKALHLARNAADAALALNPELAEAHTTLGYIAHHYNRDLPAADAEFTEAKKLRPSYGPAHHWHAHALVSAGRFDEAYAASQVALAVDPLDVLMNAHMIWHHFMAREPELAIEHAKRTIHMEPALHWGHCFRAFAEEQIGAVDQAVASYREAVRVSDDHPLMRVWLARGYALAGDRAQARKLASTVSSDMYAYELALVSAGLGEVDEARRLLEVAREKRSGWMAYIDVDPRMEGLRSGEEKRES